MQPSTFSQQGADGTASKVHNSTADAGVTHTCSQIPPGGCWFLTLNPRDCLAGWKLNVGKRSSEHLLNANRRLHLWLAVQVHRLFFFFLNTPLQVIFVLRLSGSQPNLKVNSTWHWTTALCETPYRREEHYDEWKQPCFLQRRQMFVSKGYNAWCFFNPSSPLGNLGTLTDPYMTSFSSYSNCMLFVGWAGSTEPARGSRRDGGSAGGAGGWLPHLDVIHWDNSTKV